MGRKQAALQMSKCNTVGNHFAYRCNRNVALMILEADISKFKCTLVYVPKIFHSLIHNCVLIHTIL